MGSSAGRNFEAESVVEARLETCSKGRDSSSAEDRMVGVEARVTLVCCAVRFGDASQLAVRSTETGNPPESIRMGTLLGCYVCISTSVIGRHRGEHFGSPAED